MWKKIIAGALFVGLIGILVTGAVIRTMDKTGHVVEAQGQGQGRGYGSDPDETGAGSASGYGRAGGGYGQDGGREGATERQYPHHEDSPEEWVEYEGTVVQAPEADVDLVIQTTGDEELVIGTGPMYMASQGFTLQAGERVQVRGYWGDDEFKAAQVTRLADGLTITLRDEAGRPAWAGAGRRAQGRGDDGHGYGAQRWAPGPGEGTDQG